MPQYTNDLAKETSPYLLQHAHNPVQWMPWGEKALQKAKNENKPLIVSIGYSSCHWCHVMEHESFENIEVANLMNQHFVCIKVDREEHPDVDSLFMNALHLISGSGGWPLNCFALPDGRPFFGGTYFKKNQWMSVLDQIKELYQHDLPKIIEFAERIESGIADNNRIVKDQSNLQYSHEDLHAIVNNWQRIWDMKEGGPNRAPKFPLPNNYEFLLAYAQQFNHQASHDFVQLTLRKMAFGGLYDQIGGGFARYSTDLSWKVPHFEKMLYDNAQLISLYAHAFQQYQNPVYKTIVEESLAFIQREMTSPEGLFYSALDADSAGHEGLFYLWTLSEIDKLLKGDAVIFKDYFQMNEIGFWEQDFYILMRSEQEDEIAQKHGLSYSELQAKISRWKSQLLEIRTKRIRPALDDKQLVAWNALMINAYLDAYKAIGTSDYYQIAEHSLQQLLKIMDRGNTTLYHTYNNQQAKIEAYLDDYAFVIEALLKIYQLSFNEKYLETAHAYLSKVIELFYHETNGMFYFSQAGQSHLAHRNIEIQDNVIPSSNSTMSKNLMLLGRLLERDDYQQIARQMLQNIISQLESHPSAYANWAFVMLSDLQPQTEIAIVGKDSIELLNQLNRNYFPLLVIAGSREPSKLSLLKNRFVAEKTLLYICENHACQLPIESVEEAILRLK
jgi:uncharacterized protein YyaL (SSP411 family)